MFTGLAAAGAQIVVNDVLPPDRRGLFPDGLRIDRRQDELGRADHRKLYVVDGAVAWTGGAGIEDHFHDGGFHDVMVRVTGDVVRQAQAAFLTSFHGHGGPLPADLSPLFPEPGDPGSTPVALAQVIPGGYVAASQAIPEQIDGARERLDVMNPYLTDGDMVERILAAARRGVRVRIVVSADSNNALAAAALGTATPSSTPPASRCGSPGHRRPRQGRRRRRRRELRHGQPRRLGALPQLGDHDARPQRPSAAALMRRAAVRAGHRPRPARRGRVDNPGAARGPALRQARVLPASRLGGSAHGPRPESNKPH